jgi:oxygen-independent coproporphyrinogen-3 oxidase
VAVGPNRGLGLRRHLAECRDDVSATPVGLYLHVPFCSLRCGYCAFVTSTLGLHAAADAIARFHEGVASELQLLGEVLGDSIPPLSSIYIGGGTPTVLGGLRLAAILGAARDNLPVASTAEVTVEANPEGLDPGDLAHLAAAGVTRMSFGVQSAVPRVLEVLDRVHQPSRIPEIVAEARRAGISHLSVDLIHGVPGETPEDWRASLELAITAEVGHVSCYALSVEPGTKLASRVRAGSLPEPRSDDAAERYRTADRVLGDAGFEWYELSNWARTPAERCSHNILYWRNRNWIGAGPAAHSHLSGLRWWNHRRPGAWSAATAAGLVPSEGHELVRHAGRRLEQVMLGVRLREGLPLRGLDPDGVADVVAAGWARRDAGRLVLTLEGRLLADAVLRAVC